MVAIRGEEISTFVQASRRELLPFLFLNLECIPPIRRQEMKQLKQMKRRRFIGLMNHVQIRWLRPWTGNCKTSNKCDMHLSRKL
jgi:ABC-type dipeptide/oligopeptide/nickel transport system ATPase component